MKTQNKKPNRNRHGVAAVEAALMLPLLVITIFGSIDIAQYVNSAQIVANASREGARVGSQTNSNDTQTIESHVLDYMEETFPTLSRSQLESAVTIEIKSDGENGQTYNGSLSEVESGETLSVNVDFDFEAVRWLPGPFYPDLSIETVFRRD